MQIMPTSSSCPPTPLCSSKHSHAPSHRHISFEVAHVPHSSGTNTFDASRTTTSPIDVNVIAAHDTRLDVVDLTDSSVESPCSPDPSLSLSPSSFTPPMIRTTKVRPTRPPRSLSPPPASKSTSLLPAPPSSAPAALAPLSRAGSPRKRPTFLLPSDNESDRDRDLGEGDNVHDDSDDSDRTSFFSAEEFLVPASALREAVNTEGQVLHAESSHGGGNRHAWQSLEIEPEPEPVQQEARSKHDTKEAGEQDAAYGLRRWHALMEIVHTEAGYVRDLRALVTVYLAVLPTLPLSAPALKAVQELSREASEILTLHERFSRALEGVSAHAIGGATPIGSVDEAVKQVAGLFIEEASTFDLYQRFCAVQPDALRLLRPAQARAEWTAFERQCAAGGYDATESETSASSKEGQTTQYSEAQTGVLSSPPASAPASISAETASPMGSRRIAPPRTLSLMPSAFKSYASSALASQAIEPVQNRRRHSYDSLVAVFGTSSSGIMKQRPGTVRLSSEGPTPKATIASVPSSRLRFHDFLIKPVQRICKYPLMLEGLRSKTHGESVDAAVANAVESMRAVTARVDEARRRMETATRSKLIVERIELHAVVTPDFISSLGDCLLAGSLDIVYHHHVLDPVTTPVRVKYLGAFLYLGGYLLLVKVCKGKVYRIKHWFSLVPFELVDIPQETALVPYSFRLSYMDHHFEIAAACQREKDLWMRAINEARCARPAWTNEPAWSLQTLSTEPQVPPAGSSVSQVVEPPTVLKRGSSSSSLSDLSNPLAVLRLSTARNRNSTSNPTVRYIFSLTDDFSILLRRSSGTNRILVDRGLVDVLSDFVSNLRKQAQGRGEILFPPPYFSDTSQTIGIAAKNKITRRRSMLVARPRNLPIPGSGEENAGEQPLSTVRRKSTTTNRKRMSLLPALSLLYTEPESIDNTSISVSSTDPRTLGPDSSVGGFHIPLGATSLPTSPTIETEEQSVESSSSEVTEDKLRNHRRARSLVGSVKNLVRRATTKSSTQEGAEACHALRTTEDYSTDAGQSVEAGSKSSLHRRRVSSAPTSPPLSAPSVFFPDSNNRLAGIDPYMEDPGLPMESPAASTLKPADKKCSLLPPDPNHTLKPKRSFKSFMFYNRLTAVDPA